MQQTVSWDLDKKRYNDTIVLLMANYITTNIRLPEEDYFRLKEEALKKRKSFAALVREKVGAKNKKRSKAEVEKIMAETRKLAKRNAHAFGDKTGVEIIREMRDNAKW